jgi:hypothetical protein
MKNAGRKPGVIGGEDRIRCRKASLLQQANGAPTTGRADGPEGDGGEDRIRTGV